MRAPIKKRRPPPQKSQATQASTALAAAVAAAAAVRPPVAAKLSPHATQASTALAAAAAAARGGLTRRAHPHPHPHPPPPPVRPPLPPLPYDATAVALVSAFGAAGVSASSSEGEDGDEKLLDLAGSTSAAVRKMGSDERALVHYKRRLRNRESAKRSRARRQQTMCEIQVEVEDLREVANGLVERCVRLAREGEDKNAIIEVMRKERAVLEGMLRER